MTQFSLNINADALTLFLIASGLIALSFFVYRFTVPPVSRFLKYFLIALRFAALLLLIALIFEPSVTVTEKNEKITPMKIFIDNSESVQNYAGEIKKFYTKLAHKLDAEALPYKSYSFGAKVMPIAKDSTDKLLFDEPVTNFETLFDSLKGMDDSQIAVIISDGNYNLGKNPLNIVEKTAASVFTIAAGDTTGNIDAAVSAVINNDLVYKGKTTEIYIEIKSEGLNGKKAEVKLAESGKFIANKIVEFNESGINTVKFEYTPKRIGKIKLTASVSNIKGERTFKNNAKTFYLNALKGKIGCLLITSVPTPDFSFIFNGIKNNDELEAKKIVDLPGKRINDTAISSKIDSADVLFLINFPGPQTSPALISSVVHAIAKRRKPFFLMPNLPTAKRFVEENSALLGFKLNDISPQPLEIRAAVNSAEPEPLISNKEEFEKLPPIYYYASNISLKPSASVLLSVILNRETTNLPLMIKNNANLRRSVTFLGKDMWRWKLSRITGDYPLFDELITNVAKWLNAINIKKKIKVEPVKQVFSNGERIEFVANVNNDATLPIENANVTVKIYNSGGDSFELKLVSIGEGLYRGGYPALQANDYTFTAEVFFDGKKETVKGGAFSVEEFNAESLTSSRNKNLLIQLAELSNARYAPLEKGDKLLEIISQKLKSSKRYETVSENYPLWHYELTLIFLILLFSIEWFIRKRAGLL